MLAVPIERNRFTSRVSICPAADAVAVEETHLYGLNRKDFLSYVMNNETAVMAVLSADHWIADAAAFRSDLETAMNHARATGALVTFGIRPTHPETGYGYIETQGEGAVRSVTAFREKPPLETALAYLASGRHFWNAGMFVWTLQDFRAELQRHAPDLLTPLDAWRRSGADPAQLPAAYGRLPKTSIDYALMEKSDRVA